MSSSIRHRRTDRLKHLAGVELGAGTYVNDTRPEETAAHLRRAARKDSPAGEQQPVSQKS